MTQTFLRVLPTRWRQESSDIDMEQNYVTVTLSRPIAALASACRLPLVTVGLRVSQRRSIHVMK